MTQTFFIAENNFYLRLEPSQQTVLQTCRLSPSDGEISLFWFISPHIPVSANNLPVFEIFQMLPPKTPCLKYFEIFLLALCFLTVYSKNFL